MDTLHALFTLLVLLLATGAVMVWCSGLFGSRVPHSAAKRAKWAAMAAARKGR